MVQPKRMLIKELYTPINCAPDLDLVLIHGLNGDPVETWRDQGSKKLWPQEFLPLARPNTRVLSYGYNGDIYLNNSAANIRDMARSILSNLDTRRESDLDRPIIFVAHCLGGLIVKQALCFARAERQFQDIGRATKAVFFFGTPHSGANKTDWKRIAESYSVLSPRKRAMTPLVNAITTSAPKLGKLCDDFVGLTGDFLIVTWYENLVWPGTEKCIVDQTSTRMMSGSDEESLPAEADHVNMCRFADQNDQTFQEMLKFVRKALGEEVRQPRVERSTHPAAMTLSSPTQVGESSDIQKRIAAVGMQDPIAVVTERFRVIEYERQATFGSGLTGQVDGRQRFQTVVSRDGRSLNTDHVQELGDRVVRSTQPSAPTQIKAAPVNEVENIPWRASEEPPARFSDSGQTRRPNIFKLITGRLHLKQTPIVR